MTRIYKRATRKRSGKKERIFDSMTSAAAALDTERSILSRAKKLGCPAFHGGRVYEKELLPWIEKNSERLAESSDDWRVIKIREQCRQLRIRNDKDEGRLISRESVARDVQLVTAASRAILVQKLENEYPAAVAGLEPPQARVYGKRVVDDILKQLQKLANKWAG